MSSATQRPAVVKVQHNLNTSGGADYESVSLMEIQVKVSLGGHTEEHRLQAHEANDVNILWIVAHSYLFNRHQSLAIWLKLREEFSCGDRLHRYEPLPCEVQQLHPCIRRGFLVTKRLSVVTDEHSYLGPWFLHKNCHPFVSTHRPHICTFLAKQEIWSGRMFSMGLTEQASNEEVVTYTMRNPILQIKR